MSGDIKVLDKNTANQIAAGEVVEKPASVVKELVENSLDAGATNISVTIFAGGTEFIRVTDNGSGMSETNAKLSVLRHATSKITSANDLLSLHTLGFRGEALPSIASVSKFNMLTRLPQEEFATSITMDGDSIPDVGRTGGNIGTTITVRDLFFNVPARRKFLRTVNTEGRYINEIIAKVALSRPEVHFSLTNNDKEIVNTPGNSDLKDTIAALYGKNVSQELLAVDYADNGIKITGFIGKPTVLKGTRQWQSIFVNGRIINNRMISKAIDHAYQSQIPKSGFPFAVIKLEMDSNTIDINVHPQKSEIKFGDEGAVYRVVYHALTDALTKPLGGQEIPGSLEGTIKGGVIKAGPAESLAGGHGQGGPVNREYYAPHQEQIWKPPDQIGETPAPNILAAQRTGEPIQNDNIQTAEVDKIAMEAAGTGVDTIWPLGQINRTFIVAQSEKNLYLIDQHAAHERIMYDRFIRRQEPIPTQQFLMPIFVEADKEGVAMVEEKRQEFLKLGVDVEPAGETLLRVSGLPADIENSRAEGFIHDILNLLAQEKAIKPTDLREEVLHYAACHSAIRAGEVLNMRQMRQVILQLLNTEHPFTCPHGRPCMVEISTEELFKMFKRT
ncbi:MAG: DNA mismatch repair endonuclease MutL [Acidaminococcaceae bacterium]|jgi:DNA mismatch repair protein MutL|nr:DNA mismatch repair endonuclease MutL [Acidaminococcaceae bacterium]